MAINQGLVRFIVEVKSLATLGQVAQKCHLGMNRHFFLFLYVRLFPMAIIPSRGAIRSAFAPENLLGIPKPRICSGTLSVGYPTIAPPPFVFFLKGSLRVHIAQSREHEAYQGQF